MTHTSSIKDFTCNFHIQNKQCLCNRQFRYNKGTFTLRTGMYVHCTIKVHLGAIQLHITEPYKIKVKVWATGYNSNTIKQVM